MRGDGNSGIISTITKAARKVATGDSTVLGVYVEALVLSALILLAEYLRKKMSCGTKLYMLVDEKPVGIVSVTGSLIEDLYIHPDMQNMGYGTKLLQYAIDQCADTPTLWILENNKRAERLYRRMGFKETGRKNLITHGLDEIEFIFK